MPASERLIGLQFGRGLAAVSVAVAHAMAHPFPHAEGLASLSGRLGVTLFFVISGFIMVMTTGRGSFDPLGFLRRRLIRIVPLYYVATLIVVALVLVAPSIFKDTPFDLRHIVYSLLFIPVYAPGGSADVTPFLKLGWTLEYEMFFYVVFASLFAASDVARAALLTLIFGALIICGQMFAFESAAAVFYTRIDTLGFVAGVWLAVLMTRKPSWMTMRAANLAIALSVLLFGVALATYDVAKDHPAAQVAYVALCALFLFGVTIRGQSWRGRLSDGVVLIGDASYSIYLFHMFAVGAVYLVAKTLMMTAWPLLSVAAASVGALAVGVAVYLLLERPLNAFVRSRLAARPRPKPDVAIYADR